MQTPKIIYVFVIVTLVLHSACGGEQTVIEEQGSLAPAGAPDDLVQLLPADNGISGWSQDGEPRFFTPDNLWEFINGAAEGYLLYGFEEVVTADYANESLGQSAVIDIYRMMDAVHAFGIYCQERNPNYEFIDIGAEGYVGGTAMNFWRGPYYVKMTVFEETEALKEELKKLARRVSEKIDYPATEPSEVAYLPSENRKPRSLQFVPRDVLGQSYLTHAFEAQYEAGGQGYKMVAVLSDSPDTAQDGFTKYKEFLARGGQAIEELGGFGDEGFVGTDNYYGKVMAVRAGDKLLIILGPPSEDIGKTALVEMLRRVEQSSADPVSLKGEEGSAFAEAGEGRVSPSASPPRTKLDRWVHRSRSYCRCI